MLICKWADCQAGWSVGVWAGCRLILNSINDIACEDFQKTDWAGCRLISNSINDTACEDFQKTGGKKRIRR